MALRLRRGTDAERLAITPLEGELIYTTDTEKLFIGDGTTAGGNPVDTDSITDELSDLNDVDTTGLADGNTLAYNLANTRFEPAALPTEINDLTDVDTSAVSMGDVLKWNGVAFVPGAEGPFTEGGLYNINIDGDIEGSVFGDDSTLLVDGVNGKIVGEVDTTRVTTNFLDNINQGLIVNANFLREETSAWAGGITEFTKQNHGVLVNGTQTNYWTHSYSTDQYSVVPDPAAADYGTFLKIWKNGKVMINGALGGSGFDDLAREPDSQLDIYGVMKLTPQTSAPTSPVEGMIAVADRVTWDPASVGSGSSYPVYYNGTGWDKMT